MESDGQRYLLTAAASLIAHVITTAIVMVAGFVAVLISIAVLGTQFETVGFGEITSAAAGVIATVALVGGVCLLVVQPALLRVFMRMLCHERLSYGEAVLSCLAGAAAAVAVGLVELLLGGFTLGSLGWLTSVAVSGYVAFRFSAPAETGGTIPDDSARPLAAHEAPES